MFRIAVAMCVRFFALLKFTLIYEIDLISLHCIESFLSGMGVCVCVWHSASQFDSTSNFNA